MLGTPALDFTAQQFPDPPGSPLSPTELELLIGGDAQPYAVAILSAGRELAVIRTRAVDSQEAVIQAMCQFENEVGEIGTPFMVSVMREAF